MVDLSIIMLLAEGKPPWKDGCEFLDFIFLCDALWLYFLIGRKARFYFESMDGLSWLHGSMVITKLW